MQQRISVEREPGAAVVTAHGELDAFAAPALTDAFAEAQVDGNDRLLIDLHGVSFMDSTALGLVVKAVNEVVEAGGGARIVLPETTARRIFEITTLDRVLPIAPSRATALIELAGPSAEGRAPDTARGD